MKNTELKVLHRTPYTSTISRPVTKSENSDGKLSKDIAANVDKNDKNDKNTHVVR